MDLEGLLKQLHQAGTLQGSGNFTLDPARARHLLQRYRVEPHEYGLLVVQAAVRARARELWVNLEDEVTSFTLAGVTFDRDTLRQIPEMVLTPGAEGAMALALWVASQRKPREIRLESGGWRLAMPQRTFVETGSLDLRLEVDERRTWKDRLLRRAAPPDAREPLRTSCREIPLPVEVNGARLQIAFDLTSCLSARLLEHPDYTGLPVKLPAHRTQPSPGSFAAAVGLTDLEPDCKTLLVVEGVTYTGPVLKGIRAIVWTGHLPVNLSLGAVVKGPELEELLAQLRGVADALTEELWQDLPELPKTLARRAADFVHAGFGSADPRLARMLEIKIGIGGYDATQLTMMCLNLGERAGAEGDLATAEACYRRILDLWPQHRDAVLHPLVQVLKKRKAPPSEVEPYWRDTILSMSKKLPKGNERAALAAYFEELGNYCLTTGHEGEAEKHFVQAAQLLEASGQKARAQAIRAKLSGA
jgi:hypothetical protein